MDRLRDADTTLVVPNPHDIPPPGSIHDKPGFFVDCDLEAGFLGTPFRAYWANMITECIRNAILKAGIVPEYTDWTQLGLAIEKIADRIARELINILVPPMIIDALNNFEYVQNGGNVTGTIKGGKFTLNAPTPPPPVEPPPFPAIENHIFAIGTGASITNARWTDGSVHLAEATDGTAALAIHKGGLSVLGGTTAGLSGNKPYVIRGGTSASVPGTFDNVYEGSVLQSPTPDKYFAHYAAENGAQRQFAVSLNGNVFATNTSLQAADYAEWFETADGTPLEAGVSVVLDGAKVRAAQATDDPRDIIGVTRPLGAPGVIGNAAEANWANLYMTDAFGAPIWTETVDVDGQTYRSHAVNPEYDPNRSYIPRSQRPEWVLIGLLGQVPVCQGQPLGDRWRVMRPAADGVDLIFIR